MIIRQVPTANPRVEIFEVTIDREDNAWSYAVNDVSWYWSTDVGETHVTIANETGGSIGVNYSQVYDKDIYVIEVEEFPVQFALYIPVPE